MLLMNCLGLMVGMGTIAAVLFTNWRARRESRVAASNQLIISFTASYGICGSYSMRKCYS
jgi:hypothetical protein